MCPEKGSRSKTVVTCRERALGRENRARALKFQEAGKARARGEGERSMRTREGWGGKGDADHT